MTRAEKILASRLLDMAAAEYHEHGCNDMPLEAFEGISTSQREALTEAFNRYRREAHADGYAWKLQEIGDDKWMEFLADVVGRA